MKMRITAVLFVPLFSLFALLATGAPPPDHATPLDYAIPRYSHIFVVVDENQDASQVDGVRSAPALTWIAHTFGNATNFHGETHPSEPNYAALLGGSTLGIHDDDAFFCRPGPTDGFCPHAADAHYPPHATPATHLGDQLAAAGYTWKGYYQGIPSNGSLAVTGHNPLLDGPSAPDWYAAKHSGFLNFASVAQDPQRAEHLVGFDSLERDLARNTAPNFALIVPNLCDDMHGMQAGPGVPVSCQSDHPNELIGRGDKMIRTLYTLITESPLWREKANSALVITFDEDDAEGSSNHIATMVVTNHPPKHLADSTFYNHYSLLRTIEDAFGSRTYLGHADDTSNGVQPMYPLFAIQK
jgi:hypothetical protein